VLMEKSVELEPFCALWSTRLWAVQWEASSVKRLKGN